MYSIKLKKPEIIKEIELIDIQKLKPHENVIKSRKDTLKEYIKSYNNYVVIPSIICCSKTFMIIDGHHRYQTLLELGAKKVPVTVIDYFDDSIRTHNEVDKKIEKTVILNSLEGEKLPPKSTIHEVQTVDLKWKPIILISSLCEFRI